MLLEWISVKTPVDKTRVGVDPPTQISRTSRLISYAQNFEDVMLARVFAGRDNGFYVDVGAADPINLSVTKWFYDLGWSGLNIEPNKQLFGRLVADRPRDINLDCGVGAVASEAEFLELEVGELSSFDPRVQQTPENKARVVEPRIVKVAPADRYAGAALQRTKHRLPQDRRRGVGNLKSSRASIFVASDPQSSLPRRRCHKRMWNRTRNGNRLFSPPTTFRLFRRGQPLLSGE